MTKIRRSVVKFSEFFVYFNTYPKIRAFLNSSFKIFFAGLRNSDENTTNTKPSPTAGAKQLKKDVKMHSEGMFSSFSM